MMLRIQRERMTDAFFPSLKEYSIQYGLTLRRLELAASDCIVMHPGPVNRGIEISSEVVDSARSLILDQVTNGVAVRMAILFLAQSGSESARRRTEAVDQRRANHRSIAADRSNG